MSTLDKKLQEKWLVKLAKGLEAKDSTEHAVRHESQALCENDRVDRRPVSTPKQSLAFDFLMKNLDVFGGPIGVDRGCVVSRVHRIPASMNRRKKVSLSNLAHGPGGMTLNYSNTGLRLLLFIHQYLAAITSVLTFGIDLEDLDDASTYTLTFCCNLYIEPDTNKFAKKDTEDLCDELLVKVTPRPVPCLDVSGRSALWTCQIAEMGEMAAYHV